MTSPVIVTSTGIPLSSDQSRATTARASGSVPDSSAAGIDASTDRRASARLSRASRFAFSRWRSRSAAPLLRMVGRLELGDDPGQPLGDRVVDLAGHPLSFVEHARLAGLGQQLGVETGVLLERDLEPGEGDAALLVLLGHLLAEHRPGADRDGLDDDDREIERPALRSSAGGPAMSVLTRMDVTAMPTTASGSGRSAVA